ncbi:hypothetical protein LINPERHAP2_LOCUS15360 [Linum perenne]
MKVCGYKYRFSVLRSSHVLPSIKV